MPGVLEKIAAARKPSAAPPGGRKAWSEPTFWDQDAARFPFLSSFNLSSDREQIENDFDAYISAAYKSNGVVFSTIAARQHIFSQATFAWRTFSGGKGGDLWTNADLDLLQRPGPSSTTGELLSRMDVTASLAGSYYSTVADDAGRLGRAATGPGRRIAYLRPDWITILIGSHSGDPNAADAKVIAYEYRPLVGSVAQSAVASEPVILLPSEVCHYSPQPDPAARFRGMSWLTPILRDIQADKAATVHKERYFANGAHPSTVIALKDVDDDAFEEFVEKFNAEHKGAANAYKTLFLAGGADVTPLTTDLQALDFKNVQGGGETRIAMAAGMHPVIVGMSEGLQGSSLNEGNFTAARRLVGDKTMRHLWAVAAASLESLLTVPNGATRLWPDLREVAFLRDDAKDLAEIQSTEGMTIRNLVDAGFEPASVTAAVIAQDWKLLKHTGVYSVQLQPPGTTADAPSVTTDDMETAMRMIRSGWTITSRPVLTKGTKEA